MSIKLSFSGIEQVRLKPEKQTRKLLKTRNFLICFWCFDRSCSILEQDKFIENLYVILSCVIE